jgi:hypothetical protein
MKPTPSKAAGSAPTELDAVAWVRSILLDKIALLRDIKTAESQVAKGKAVSHATAAKQLRAKLAK